MAIITNQYQNIFIPENQFLSDSHAPLSPQTDHDSGTIKPSDAKRAHQEDRIHSTVSRLWTEQGPYEKNLAI